MKETAINIMQEPNKAPVKYWLNLTKFQPR